MAYIITDMAKLREQRWLIKKYENFWFNLRLEEREPLEDESNDEIAKWAVCWASKNGGIEQMDFLKILPVYKNWLWDQRLIFWLKTIGRPESKSRLLVRKQADHILGIYKDCIGTFLIEKEHNHVIHVERTERGSNLLNFSGYWKEVWIKHKWVPISLFTILGAVLIKVYDWIKLYVKG